MKGNEFKIVLFLNEIPFIDFIISPVGFDDFGERFQT